MYVHTCHTTDLPSARRLLRDGLRCAVPLVVHHEVPTHDLALALPWGVEGMCIGETGGWWGV